jgi:ParB family chromosome partitioning protein
MATRRALGKGLSSLIPNQGQVSLRVTEIPVKDIVANKYQPRKSFGDVKLKELTASIQEKGVIQPILVQKSGMKYELIAGERRLRASRALGLRTIPAIIKNVQGKESLELALIENIQREELNPIEEANAYQLLISEFGITQEEVGKRVSRNRSTITNTLRLLKLPKEIQNDIVDGRLTMGHARAILACDTEVSMMQMRKQIIEYGLNVREVEARAKKKKTAKTKGKASPQSSAIRNAAETLKRSLSTKVTILENKKGGGVITIEYYSGEDLERILENF